MNRSIFNMFFMIILLETNAVSIGVYPKKLALADVKHQQFSRFPDVRGFTFEGDTLISFDGVGNHYYKTEYRKSSSDLLAFTSKPGQVSDSIRYKLNVGKSHSWIASYELIKGIKLFFSQDLWVLAQEKGSRVNYESIIIDHLKPAADSRGEPTRVEIANLRSRMSKQGKSLKIVGVSWGPDLDGDDSQFVVATNLPGFKVTTMMCSRGRLGFCRFMRRCLISDGRGQSISSEYLGGIAYKSYNKNSRVLLLGDRQYNRIFVYSYHSCYHVRQVAVIDLPENLGKLRELYIDGNDNLWVSTQKPDLLNHSSLYMWPKKCWQLEAGTDGNVCNSTF